jgi:hypothetical protein
MKNRRFAGVFESRMRLSPALGYAEAALLSTTGVPHVP